MLKKLTNLQKNEERREFQERTANINCRILCKDQCSWDLLYDVSVWFYEM
jgi:hypothetical protein